MRWLKKETRVKIILTMEQKMAKAVLFVCPKCGFEMYDSVEELMDKYNFDGKSFKPLPKFECHGCHSYMVKASMIKEIPASWLEPF